MWRRASSNNLEDIIDIKTAIYPGRKILWH